MKTQRGQSSLLTLDASGAVPDSISSNELVLFHSPVPSSGLADCQSAIQQSATLRDTAAQRRGQAGVLLIECMVYIAVLAVILGVAWMVFFRADKNSRGI